MAVNPGSDEASLRKLAKCLARESFFGDNTMSISSPSGRSVPGQSLRRLDPALMRDLRNIIKQRARKGEGEFEGLWSKCVQSISKDCQNLRKGLLRKRFA